MVILIKRLNDFLTCASIQKVGNIIRITMTKYFSPEEYSLGDRMIFNTFSVTGTLGRRSKDLETFLNRETGHRIVSHQ